MSPLLMGRGNVFYQGVHLHSTLSPQAPAYSHLDIEEDFSEPEVNLVPSSPQPPQPIFSNSNNRVVSPAFAPPTPVTISPQPRRPRGKRSKSTSVQVAKKLEPEPVNPVELNPVKGVTVVNNRAAAKKVVERLYAHRDAVFACDTEVADIDVKTVGPVGNGEVICLSVYGGPDVDFGEGPNRVLWIDNLEEKGVLDEFKGWLEDPNTKKVWHNYGFDRHVLHNMKINCLGFAGDTMHMARLWDSSRDKAECAGSNGNGYGNGNGNGHGNGENGNEDTAVSTRGYSLEALSKQLEPKASKSKSMKELFGRPRMRKDGTAGSILEMPDDIRDLQTKEEFREDWIKYSADDAIATWALHWRLEVKLRRQEWRVDQGRGEVKGNMLDFYQRYLVPFGECLTDMERAGIRVDASTYLASVTEQARKDQAAAIQRFLDWASKMTPNGCFINPSSAAQIQTLLFGGMENSKTREPIPDTRTFKVLYEELTDYQKSLVDKLEAEKESQRLAEETAKRKKLAATTGPVDLDSMKVAELKAMCKERGLKVTGKKDELRRRLLETMQEPPSAPASEEKGDDLWSYSEQDLRDCCSSRSLDASGTKEEMIHRLEEDTRYVMELQGEKMPSKASKKATAAQEIKIIPKKWHEFDLTSIRLTPVKYTASGAPAVTADALRKLAGNPSEKKWGMVYNIFGGGEKGEEACFALDALCSMGSIDTMLSNFLEPLQALVDKKSRIHCSLNLNTETGRLSSRRPNLQNQPALEKDQYKIRKAFVSEEGKSLVVADYGQLELRLLAHITRCESMIRAFKEGGCFHSRTAVGMFPHVKEAVDKGECLLEWDSSKGAAPAPLLKDKYGSERRKAKTLNFSIAYGKTPHGLSKDWGVTVQEANDMLQAWYADRPEVKQWQEEVIQKAHDVGYSQTLMGRYRQLPGIKNKKTQGHAERAAINTPVQGGAADVVMMAMLKIQKSKVLRDLKWTLLLQIHDEVILEGPEESSKEALAEVKRCMENPFDDYGLEPLLVKLEVDARIGKSWYDCK